MSSARPLEPPRPNATRWAWDFEAFTRKLPPIEAKRDADGNVIPAEGDESDDSSGGETTIGDVNDSALAVSSAIELLLGELQSGDAPLFLERASELIRRGYRLLGFDELRSDVRRRLRDAVRQLQAAVEQEDPDATQPPDELMGDGSGDEAGDGAGDGGMDDDAPSESRDERSGGGADEPSLASQLADDLEALDDDELAEEQPGAATQLEEVEMEDSTAQARKLKQLRDEAVALLRSAPVDDGAPIPRELHAAADALRKKVQAFAAVREAARQIMAALAELLRRPVAAAAAGPSAVAPEGEFVGRSAWKRQGTEEWLFLYRKRGTYRWFTLEAIRSEPELQEAFDRYDGPRGRDPDGFVRAVLDASGSLANRTYKVQWAVDGSVPVRVAQEWRLRRELISTRLADAFDRGDDGDEGGDSDDSDDPGAQPGAQPGARFFPPSSVPHSHPVPPSQTRRSSGTPAPGVPSSRGSTRWRCTGRRPSPHARSSSGRSRAGSRCSARRRRWASASRRSRSWRKTCTPWTR